MNKDLQSVIKYIFFGGEPPVIADHAALLSDMSRHCIIPLLGINRVYVSLGFSPEDTSAVRGAVYDHVKNFSDVLNEQSALTELLAGIGMKPVIIKGFSAARYYPDPALRTTGDIDFLVRGPLSVENVAEYLSGHGYEVEDYVNSANSRHIGISRKRVRFEMHRYFSLRSCTFDEAVDSLIEGAEPVECSLQGVRFYSFPDAVNGLVLLEHISHHFCSSGLGFRQIIDWMCYVNFVLNDEFWSSSFRALAESTGLLTLAVHATRMCELLFGLPCHEFTRDADESVCLELAEDIYKSGNFGRNYDGMVNQISGFANTGNFFRRLQQGGMCRWEAARKHRILRPFAWLYQLVRIAFIMLRPSELKKLRGGRELADSRGQLYKALGLAKYRQD